jgi:hypothetical protein
MHQIGTARIKRREGTTMRTTLDLPEQLVKDAMDASHQRSKTAVIITALEELVRKSRLQELRHFKGKVKLDVDLDVLRKRA